MNSMSERALELSQHIKKEKIGDRPDPSFDGPKRKVWVGCEQELCRDERPHELAMPC